MLRELSVQNLALIEDVRVELQPGFCAWTGETGAGKTLLLSALGLLTGQRGDADLIRAGSDEIRITGCFELGHDSLRQAIEQILDDRLEEHQLIITRRLGRAGRSIAYANERPISIGTLRQLGAVLVNVHGQRESQQLLDAAYQLLMLDTFGGLLPLRDRYAERAESVRQLRRRRDDLLAHRQQRQRELALLRFEREELQAAELVRGEWAELNQERQRLVHALALTSFAETGCARLHDEEGSLCEHLVKLQREAAKWATVDPQLLNYSARLEALAAETKDLAQTLRDLAAGWQADPARHDAVEHRLSLLHKLQTKYGRSADELVDYLETLDAEEKKLQQQEDDVATVEKALADATAALREAAQELSAARHKTARKLAAAVQKQLSELGMPDAQLEAAFEPVGPGDGLLDADIPTHGFERLELMLSANRGEVARPLRKVASGGELSRTMLALKTVLANQDRVGTLVFDEVDANVGGRLGDVLGQKLAALARSHQIICVTHLPQVASYARHHWTIRKVSRGKRTVTTIVPLADEERLDELSTMLRGAARGETTRQEAADMLAAARGKW